MHCPADARSKGVRIRAKRPTASAITLKLSGTTAVAKSSHHEGSKPIKSRPRRSGISRRSVLTTVAALPMLSLPRVRAGWAQGIDPLPSWNKGVAKETIIGFVRAAVDGSGRTFVPPEARIATFDQDGTLWVEHPMYTQVTYCLERVPAVVAEKPEL